GMQDFDGVIKKLIEDGAISLEDGLSYATNQNNLLLQLKGLSSSDDYRNGKNTLTAVQPLAPPPPAAAPSGTSVLDMIE
ncbi:MAG: twitching motility protein, partial [Alphaproteobacteria bacterium]